MADLTKEAVETFLTHPDWGQMEEYIMEHFNHETDITTIDTSKETSIVHAEVIARQRIKQDIDSLKRSFAQLRSGKDNKKISYE